MIFAIKEICIFMLIAQAILFFVPGGAYIKYVRILAGILIILRITEPLLAWVAEGEIEKEIQGRMAQFFGEAKREEPAWIIEDESMGIYNSIEEELKKRLAVCSNDYQIREVELDEEEGRVVVTVALQEQEEKEKVRGEIRVPPVILGDTQAGRKEPAEKEETDEELLCLKEQYGSCIGVDPERIVIRKAGE